MPDNLVHGNYAVTISDLEGADDLKFFQCDMPSGTVQISNVKHFGADNGTPVPLSGGGHQTTWNPITMTRYKDASTALYDWFKKVTEVGAVEGDTKQSPTIVVHSNENILTSWKLTNAVITGYSQNAANAQTHDLMTETASTQPTSLADDLKPMKWLIIIQGVAGILLGLMLLLAPGASSVVLVQFLALYWLISGVIGLVSLAWDRTQWGWKIFGGLLGIIAGVAVIRHPLYATVLVTGTLVVFMGILALAFGVMNLVRAFSGGGGWGMGILGVVDIVIGLILVFNALVAALFVPVVLGAFILVGGIASIIMAWRMG